MKNLAKCKPSEFLIQTNKIRKSVEKWLKVTDLKQIRKTAPVFSNNATDEERERATEEQVQKNMAAIFDAILEKHPAETLELLALLCFVEPDHVDDYPMEDYLEAFADIIKNKAVLGFFTSLAQLAQTGILT